MVKHIVMWKLKDTAEGGTKKENALKIKAGLEGLVGKIEGLCAAAVGINAHGPESNYDIVLVADLENGEALAHYQTHPEHLKVAAFVRAVVEARTAVDYEY